MSAVMDDLLVQPAQQGRSETPVPPLRMERQRQEVRVAARHTGDGHTHQLAERAPPRRAAAR